VLVLVTCLVIGIQTFPRSVTLDPANATKIVSNPIDEIKSLYSNTTTLHNITIPPGATRLVARGNQLDVTIRFEANLTAGAAKQAFGVGALTDSNGKGGKLTKMSTGGDLSSATLDGHRFLVAAADESIITLRVLVDHSVVEVFAQNGRVVATYPYCPPDASDDGLVIFNSGPVDLKVVRADVNFVATANVIPQ
jgi:sucrose-6-phosphate hydrolase SacC (GH32 family)